MACPVLKQNIMPLLISHLSSFDYGGLLIVTTKVPFILLTMMSSMNGLNTSRSIVILSIIILSMMLSSYYRSLLNINLQIFSPSHILRDVFVLWLTTLSWSYTHLEFEGGLLTCNRLWALGPPVYLYYTLCLLYKGTLVYFTTYEIQYY